MADPLVTPLTRLLGCTYPIVQTAMGWVSTAPLVIATTKAGAFGFLAAAVMTPAEARLAIAEVRRGTDKPFGVNFHSFQPGAAEIVDIIIENAAQIRAVSFGRGPDAKMIARFKNAGILCMPTVGAVKHAQKMVQLGVDIVTVQGGEGGGHTGSVPTTVLLPQVLDAVQVPVVAAGGFSDGRGLAAALAFGAVGIAMGTRFLMTRESAPPEGIKARYVEAGTDDIYVSTKVDGLPQRMIRNQALDKIERSSGIGLWIRAMESGLQMKKQTNASYADMLRSAKGMTSHGGLSLPQAMMAAAAPMLIQRAVVSGDADGGLMATGLVAGAIEDLPSCAELIDGIVARARARLAAIASPLEHSGTV
ncbi:nitronate monooxygenase [Sphingomonas paeninsulae]|jgi:NAD(P)H-dependent flavin oxidoreductase YrpB (nitropropane dioxygenase family)|uniref:Nitronate monooxygenase n=1 Tax=Sphingomonas paeninsulae TaxID=2319844 RepID=A0A494TC88_SPHPE|nr:nitronate monooxygenase [Sphingomonas paeninsulae]AYJ87079.1 nitronate monooxygenase [Sphingomonas paeninsulae]